MTGAAAISRRGAAALAVGVGIGLALVFALSPLTVVTAALAPALVWMCTRGMPASERRIVWALVGAALLLRVAVVAAMFLVSDHDNQAAAILVPDEAYTLARTLRVRNAILGIPALKYDYEIAWEDYGRTSYLWVVTAAQLVFGSSPYGMRLLSTLFFLAGALLLFRMARRSFGWLPSVFGLTLILFFPTWLLWSLSLIKESLYFFLASVTLAALVAALRADTWARRALLGGVAAAAVYALRDLRDGAIPLIASGLGLGFLLYLLTANARRFALGTIALAIVAIVALSTESVQHRVLAGLQSAARVHIGHVFTVGHPYKLLDEAFYVTLERKPTLTAPEAARFALRAAASFLFVPLPSQVVTRSEMLQIPEHLIWYLLLAGGIAGLAAAMRRDRLTTCLLIGYVIPTAAVVALTNGNVGTLLRFRGLITPYVVWLGCFGWCVIMQRVLSSSRAFAEPPADAGAVPTT